MYLRELKVTYARANRNRMAAPILASTVTTSSDVASILIPLLEHESVEVVALLCLSTTQRVLCYHEVSRGVLDASLVHCREVFKAALLSNAAAVVLCHNHPSGDVTPSPEDIVLTRRLVSAGRLIGIDVVDHLIVGHGGRFFSFRDAGKI